MRGRAWLARGDEGRAFSDLKASAEREPRASEPYRIAAEHLLEARRWEESVACWNAALERRPVADLYVGRARAHAQRGDVVQSRLDAAQACRQGSSEGCALAERDAGGTGSPLS